MVEFWITFHLVNKQINKNWEIKTNKDLQIKSKVESNNRENVSAFVNKTSRASRLENAYFKENCELSEFQIFRKNREIRWVCFYQNG